MRHLLMMVGSFYSIHGFRSGRFLPYIIDVVVMFFRSHIDIPLPSVWVSTSGDICCCSTVDELLLLCCDGSCVRWAHVHIVVTCCCGCTVRRFRVKVRLLEKRRSAASVCVRATRAGRISEVGRCAVRGCVAYFLAVRFWGWGGAR